MMPIKEEAGAWGLWACLRSEGTLIEGKNEELTMRCSCKCVTNSDAKVTVKALALAEFLSQSLAWMVEYSWSMC